MRIGSKKIFHLEAWVVKVMSLYKVSGVSEEGDSFRILTEIAQHFLFDIEMSDF